MSLFPKKVEYPFNNAELVIPPQ